MQFIGPSDCDRLLQCKWLVGSPTDSFRCDVIAVAWSSICHQAKLLSQASHEEHSLSLCFRIREKSCNSLETYVKYTVQACRCLWESYAQSYILRNQTEKAFSVVSFTTVPSCWVRKVNIWKEVGSVERTADTTWLQGVSVLSDSWEVSSQARSRAAWKSPSCKFSVSVGQREVKGGWCCFL